MNPDPINKEVMPIVNDIKSKMDMLAKKYNFKIDFGFPEITEGELKGENLKTNEE